MTQEAHTPEPWAVTSSNGDIHSQATISRRWICQGPNEGALSSPPTSGVKANARRIVACVNALAGIPIEAIESGVVAELKGLALQYRDDLKRPPARDSMERRVEHINAVLAKLEASK